MENGASGMTAETTLPRVTVAFICYNQQEFIEEALLSSLGQDYPNLETVVVDDCSTDGTAALLWSLEAKFPGRLRVLINEVNVGLTANINRAIAASSGDYLCLIGGDDVLLPGKVRRQVDFMLRHPEAAFSYHQAEVFDSATGGLLYYYNDRTNIRDAGAEDAVLYDMVCAGTAMIDARDLPPLGADERVPTFSDWMLWVDTLTHSGKKALFMPGVYFRYRYHPKSVMREVDTAKFINQTADVLELIRQKYPQHGAAVLKREAEVLALILLSTVRRRRFPRNVRLRLRPAQLVYLPRGLIMTVKGYVRGRKRMGNHV